MARLRARLRRLPTWHWLLSLLSRLRLPMLSRLPWPGRRLTFRVIWVVEAADEVPEQLPRNGAVVVGSLESPSWIAFDCPCEEHHRVMLNLDARRRPAWNMPSAMPLTLHPSIDDVRPGNRCHYFIRQGKVQWAHDHDNELNVNASEFGEQL